MNKKLLALAVGAAIAMPVAALAEGPTLYGQLDVSLDSVRDDTTAPASKDDSWVVANNASRLGVKGAAETGIDGVKGIYLAEFGLKADDGNSDGDAGNVTKDPFTQRNIYVGLTGGFGTVLMGNLDTPTKSVQGKVDQFNDSAADMAAVVTGEKRAPNVVAYATPKLGDAFTATVALWQSEAVDDNIGEAISASFVYEQDALYVGLGFDKQVPGAIDAGTGVDVSGAGEDDIIRAVFGYNADTFEAGFLYQMAEDSSVANSEDTTMLLSGAYKSGDLKVKAQYGQTTGDATGSVPGADDTHKLTAIGADYMAGKSTTIYGLFAMNNAPGVGEIQTFSVGVKQKF